MRSKNHYKTLQVDPSAEPEVIAAAYKRLSLKYHPDTNKAPDATLRMQEINEAYEILSNPEKRKEYDQARSTKTTQRNTPYEGSQHKQETQTAQQQYAEEQQRQRERDAKIRHQAESERQRRESQEAERRRVQVERKRRRRALLRRLLIILSVGIGSLIAVIALLFIANYFSAAQSVLQPAKALNTPTIVSTPSLRVELSSLLPDTADLPSGINQIEGYITTNDDVAKLDPNPAAMLERLQTWGRVAGYFKRFQKSLGCEPKGLREIQVDVIRHETSNGAQQYAEWARESDQSISDRLQDISVGDYGYQFWFDDQSNCETSNTERAAGILFRRANDLGQVYVYAAKGALTDDELMAQALKLARSIDRKLANVASN